ncbi:hypothetical protein E0H64_13845 [Rhizobium leguminosarum bv. viciae]|uniref:NACHT domain-containing protein n=1 Tax=Rhizobium leguminosarum TaxID=384 RepID=UPI00103C27BA|nr:hypothetical protein [Rhizobium leguminosarum]TBZ68417.1 hypothetical protein E0H64_13845 [Rhizobium leguminosarum bv. viciae]
MAVKKKSKSSAKRPRDGNEFRAATKISLAHRVGWLCSNPKCRRPTQGPRLGGGGSVSVADAAHITAASPGGPRYDENLSPEERRSEANGIWLCKIHAHQIDHDKNTFSSEELRRWKADAERYAFSQLISGRPLKFLDEEGDLLQQLQEEEQFDDDARGPAFDGIIDKLLSSAGKHITSFEHQPNWPRHSISLNLRCTGPETEGFFAVDRLPSLLRSAREMLVLAPPGSGKTVSLVQTARKLIEDGIVPLLVPLPEWGIGSGDLFDWLLKRSALRGVNVRHLQMAASAGKLAFLLDGWNELGQDGRVRLLSELEGLRRDHPLLNVVMTTRRQSSDTPLSGSTIEIAPLSTSQQEELCRYHPGGTGRALLDATDTLDDRMRDITATPLYLAALLELRSIDDIPRSREQLIEKFIRRHERSGARRERLRNATGGEHSRFLADLATRMIDLGSTSILIEDVRRSFVQTSKKMVRADQAATITEPGSILEALVSFHLIVSDPESGVRFQHQQFLEWYASLHVEQTLMQLGGDDEEWFDFCRTVLDQQTWEEPLLFACERLAQMGPMETQAIARVVRSLLGIDPMLAAEIISRGNEDTWQVVRPDLIDMLSSWYSTEGREYAVAVMIATGRSEFAPMISKYIIDPASTYPREFKRGRLILRPASMGSELLQDFASFDEPIRQKVLSWLCFFGGRIGQREAMRMAHEDQSPSVKTEAARSLFVSGAAGLATELVSTIGIDDWDLFLRPWVDTADRWLPMDMLEAHAKRCLEKVGEPHTVLSYAARLSRTRSIGTKVKGAIGHPALDLMRLLDNFLLTRLLKGYRLEVELGLVHRIRAGLSVSHEIAHHVGQLQTAHQPKLLRGLRNGAPIEYAIMADPQTVAHLVRAYLGRSANSWLEKERKMLAHCGFSALEDAIAQAGTRDRVRIRLCCDLISNHRNRGGRLSEKLIAEITLWAELVVSEPNTTLEDFTAIGKVLASYPEAISTRALGDILADQRFPGFGIDSYLLALSRRPDDRDALTLLHGHAKRVLIQNMTNEGAVYERFWPEANQGEIVEDFYSVLLSDAVRLSTSSSLKDRTIAFSYVHAIAKNSDAPVSVAIEILFSNTTDVRQRMSLLSLLIRKGYLSNGHRLVDEIGDLLKAGRKEPWKLGSQHSMTMRLVELLVDFGDAALLLKALPMLPTEATHARKLGSLVLAAANKGQNAASLLLALAEFSPALRNDLRWIGSLVRQPSFEAFKTAVEIVSENDWTRRWSSSTCERFVRLAQNHFEGRGREYDLVLSAFQSLDDGPSKRILARVLLPTNPDLVFPYLLGALDGGAAADCIEEVAFLRNGDGGEDFIYREHMTPRNANSVRKLLYREIIGRGASIANARQCLVTLEIYRATRGRVDSENRHPDIGSGGAWPLLVDGAFVGPQGIPPRWQRPYRIR